MNIHSNTTTPATWGEHIIRKKSYAKDFQVGLLSSLDVGKQMFVDLRDSGSAVNVLSLA